MKKRLLAMLLCLCMILTMLPTVALAAPEENGVTTVNNLEDLTEALADSEVSEIIVSNTIALSTDTALYGGGKTVRVLTTGVNEQGVVQIGSDYNVFTIASGVTVTIENMTVMGGSMSAILNRGTLTMENVTVTRSGSISVSGGGIKNYSGASLILKNCSIIRNVAGYGGGIVNVDGIVVMDGCSLSENRSLSSGGGGGAAENNGINGKMYINNSVISNNTSSEIGGGINNYVATLYLMNTTVTGNATTAFESSGGGIGNHGGTLYAVNSIITDNYYCPMTGTAVASDIGQYNVNNNLYNCVYGVLQSAVLTNNSNNNTNTAGVFSEYRTAGILSGNGTITNVTYDYPVLIKTEDGRLYAPLAAVGSPAKTGGVFSTFFDYSDLSNVKMSYKVNDSDTDETSLGSLATGGTPVMFYIDGGARVAGVIGASAASVSNYYTVTVKPGENGTVAGGTIYGDTYAENDTLTLTAVPDENYYFSYWDVEEGDAITANPHTFTIVGDLTVTPVFTSAQTHTVTLTTSTGITGFEIGTDGETYTEYTGPVSVANDGNLYIRAILAANCTFNRWADGITTNPYHITNITEDVSYTPTATAIAKETTPNTTFTATGDSTGTLSNVTSGMKYKIDSGIWMDISSSTDISLTGLSACTISVVKKGNGTTTADSDAQTIAITKATKPSLTATQPSTIGGKGSIPMTAVHEYKRSTDTSWAAASGMSTELAAGVYYVRVKASGTVLASESQILIVKPVYTVSFETNGGSAVAQQEILEGSNVEKPAADPTKEDFNFSGWYVDAACTQVWDFASEPITAETTIYAKWTENSPIRLPFTDVVEADWFYGDVAYVYRSGLMQGTGDTIFSPHLTTTRGMIVTILHRLEGKPTVSGGCPFYDVKAGRYDEKAITWAAANGIVNGYGDNRFGPDDIITREQMAAILYRYASFKGYDASGQADLFGFTDVADISSYASNAIAWANKEGLIYGVGGNMLDPKGKASRDQVATILHRFCENIAR